jgi:hypothetical protein
MTPISNIENIDIDAATVLDAAETDTLSGDVRDALLTHLRAIKVPWAMLAEDEQAEHIAAVQKTGEDVVRRVVNLIAGGGMPHVVGTVAKFTVKDNIKVEFAVTSLVSNICALAEHGKAQAVLVLSNASEFIGEHAPAKADPDQPDLPMQEGKAA